MKSYRFDIEDRWIGTINLVVFLISDHGNSFQLMWFALSMISNIDMDDISRPPHLIVDCWALIAIEL
jgi:hypothetical protein